LSDLPSFIADYWGKARPDACAAKRGVLWHPLAYHSLDVAAAGDAYLEANPGALDRLAQLIGEDREAVRASFILALALHDLGKFATDFQVKAAPENRPPVWRDTVAGAPIDHAATGLNLLRSERLHQDISLLWLHQATAGHHGSPCELGNEVPHASAARLRGRSREAALAFLNASRTLFGVRPLAAKESSAKRASFLAAGIGVLADWIGSNQNWFPYRAPDLDLAGYWTVAQQLARAAISKANVAPAKVRTAFTGNDIVQHPRPLQVWAEAVPLGQGAQIHVLEDLTGAGKTEAALILAGRLIAGGRASGVYFGMPTMATANAMHHRMKDMAGHFFDGAAALILAHGGAALVDGALTELGPPERDGYGGGGETATETGRAWIADDRRKALLASAGVGTIDQALLAALPAKHQSLRLAGLSDKVLIVDEAHAYDAYTSTALAALLRFQGLHGAPVILLSATLPSLGRADLLSAYMQGAMNRQRDRIDVRADTPYPCAASWSPERGATTESIACAAPRPDVAIARVDDVASALACLSKTTARGGASVYIRNTVDDAVEAWRSAQETREDALLFHARFARCDRIAKENEVLRRFGKAARGADRAGLLIATQVVEQSLDLDFDAMASDLAPIDLLIQRAGRLWRHAGREARGADAPVLQIVGPDPVADADRNWFARAFPRAQKIYSDHGRLWIGLRALLDRGALRLPRDARDLMETVYAADALDRTPEQLKPRKLAAESTAKTDAAHAMNFALRIPDGFARGSNWDDEAKIATRLGDAGAVLRLARWDGSRLRPWADLEPSWMHWRLSEITLRQPRAAQLADALEGRLSSAIADLEAGWPDGMRVRAVPLVESNGGMWLAASGGASYDADRGFQWSSREEIG
jgi:CRISPR-associated endonuclease/helicase Cas3